MQVRVLTRLRSIEFLQMCVEWSAPLNTERFARGTPLNMQENAALSENLISFAGGGNENLFVNKVQAYLLLYSAQYFLKGKSSLSNSHRFSFRQQAGRGWFLSLPCLAKKTVFHRNSVCEKEAGAIRLVI